MRKKGWLWLAVSILAIGLLVKGIDHDQFQVAVRQMDWTRGGVAVLIYFLSQTLMALRWRMLLRVQGISIGIWPTIRLVWLGLFFNNMMPGSVGGDLLKAWYITHHGGESQKVAAVTTVFVDRVAGLAGMIVIGLVAERFVGEELTVPVLGRDLLVRHIIWSVFGLFLVGGIVLLSKRVRKLFLSPERLDRLPFGAAIRKADNAVQLYRSHPASVAMAVILTIIVQALAVSATWQLAHALGLVQVTYLQCLSVLPIIWLVSAAIPVPGGLGVMEYLFIPFFCRAIDPGIQPGTEAWVAATSQAVALAFMNRLMICVASAPGALVPILGGHLPPQTAMQEEMSHLDEDNQPL